MILVEKRNGLVLVTIDRPQQLNAFNYESLLELEKVVAQIENDREARVVVFTGAGEKSFSVGADLKEREKLSPEEVKRNLDKIGKVFSAIYNLPQPTIAAINGYAFGGGMELALCCDFRIAASGALLGLTETSLAIIPGAGGTQRLPRIVGQTKALELILTARKLTEEEAFSIGLVDEVVEVNQLIPKVEQFVAPILANGPIAVQAAKRAIKLGIDCELSEGLLLERAEYERTIPTEDRMEALHAFREKRKPHFKGK